MQEDRIVSTNLFSLKAAIIFDVAIKFDHEYNHYVSLGSDFGSNTINSQNPVRNNWLKFRFGDKLNLDKYDFKEPFNCITFNTDGAICVVKNYNAQKVTKIKICNLIKRLEQAISGRKIIFKVPIIRWMDLMKKKTDWFGIEPITAKDIQIVKEAVLHPEKFKNDEYAQTIIGKPLNPFAYEVMKNVFSTIDATFIEIEQITRIPNDITDKELSERAILLDKAYTKINEMLNLRNELLMTRNISTAA